MQIIKRQSDDIVIFTGDQLIISDGICYGPGWRYSTPPGESLVLETVAALPDGFIPGGWSYSGGTWTSTTIAEQAILAQARAVKIIELEAARIALEYSDIDHAGQTWSADKDARALLAQVLAPGSVSPDAYWRDSSGSKHPMTYADLQALGRAISDRGYAADTNLKTKKAAVAEATTAAEINAIVW